MADLLLCTDSTAGPYLIASDSTANALAERLAIAGIPFEREQGLGQADPTPARSLLCLGTGANLATLSQLLNAWEYDWELAGL